MSKATFVNEIPSKIEGNEVPTLSLVKSMIPEVVHEFVSSSDAGIEWILPEGSKFKKEPENYGGYRLPISIQNCTGFTIHLNDQTCQIDESTGNLYSICGIDNLFYSNFKIEASTAGTIEDDITLMISDIKMDGLALDYTETLTVHVKKETDMSSTQVMTANSVNGYVQDELSNLDTKFSQTNHDHQSEVIIDSIREFTTENLYISISGNLFKATDEGVKISKTEYRNLSIVNFDVYQKSSTYIKSRYTNLIGMIFEENSIKQYRTEDTEGNYVFKIPQSNSFVCRIELSSISGENRFIISRGPTDLNSPYQLMTANAVRGYVEKKLAALESRIAALEGKT